MKRSFITIAVTSIIFAHVFPVQARPQSGIPKAVQEKKTSTKKSTPSSSQEDGNPTSDQEALRDFNFEKMVKLNWQAMYEAGLNLENKMLRATFLLKMCEAVINQSTRQSFSSRDESKKRMDNL